MAFSTAQIDRQRRRAALLGIAAGLRSQIPLAHLVHAADRGDLTLGHIDLDRWLRDPRAVQLVTVSAIGELLIDKLPFVPPRTKPGPFVGRLVFGAIAGAVGSGQARGGSRKAVKLSAHWRRRTVYEPTHAAHDRNLMACYHR